MRRKFPVVEPGEKKKGVCRLVETMRSECYDCPLGDCVAHSPTVRSVLREVKESSGTMKKSGLVSLLLVAIATMTASSGHADDCGTSDRVALPACAVSGKIQGSSAGFFVDNRCWHPITVKFDKSGGDLRVDIPAGKRVDQTPLPADTKISCCPRYNSCANETTPPPAPSPGLTCGKKVRLKSWSNQYLTRSGAAQGVTAGAATADSVWTVVCANSKIQLKSTKGDFLHRPDGNGSITTYSGGVGNEWIGEVAGGKVRLKSWKGDYLHFNNGLSMYLAGNGIPGSDWTVETL
jgi:hypothetical protein